MSEDDYRAGVAAATARLVGIVAVLLGDSHPVLERMVAAAGELVRDDR